jgi:hypothetical protein
MALVVVLSNNNNIQDILMAISSISYTCALYNCLPALAVIPSQRLLQCRPARRQKARVLGKDFRKVPRDLVQVCSGRGENVPSDQVSNKAQPSCAPISNEKRVLFT